MRYLNGHKHRKLSPTLPKQTTRSFANDSQNFVNNRRRFSFKFILLHQRRHDNYIEILSTIPTGTFILIKSSQVSFAVL